MLFKRSSESAVPAKPQEDTTFEETEEDETEEDETEEKSVMVEDAAFEDTTQKSSPIKNTIDSTTEKSVFPGPFAPSEALNIQETFKVDPPMQSIGNDWKAGRQTSNFTMPVSEGRNLKIQVERFESIGEDGGEFIGTVEGALGSRVHLSYRGSAEAGRIDIPSEGRSYQILPGKDGAIIVQDRNPSLEAQAGTMLPLDGIELPPAPDFIPPPPPSGTLEGIPRSDPMP